MENSKTYGSAYKELRLSKKFTLKEAAGTSISIGQLSNFENGKSILRVDSFFSVLKNINVTNLEFEVSLDKHSEIKAFPYNVDLSDIYLTRNTDVILKS
ncbi:helix-turn-helix domain-containing protein [Lactococcus fujiensis]|nr:helix-turn-helix transcriptional regulator [Lactococcus fujiensis]